MTTTTTLDAFEPATRQRHEPAANARSAPPTTGTSPTVATSSPTATIGSLLLSGALFVAYPAIRPFSDETTLQAAAAYASPSWVIAHSAAMLGFIALAIGVHGIVARLVATPGARIARGAQLLVGFGVAATLPYYGAETFGLHALGQTALHRSDASLIDLARAIRFGPGVVYILTGLALLALGGVLLAVAVWRSGWPTRWSGLALAAGLVLFLPQFSAPQPVRIGHGVLLLVGTWSLARAVWHADQASTARRRTRPAPRSS